MKREDAKYRMPAEWEPHEGTWLAWPHNRETWPGKFEKIPTIWVRIIRELSQGEKAFVCVSDPAMEERARHTIQSDPVGATVRWNQVQFVTIPTNDAWVRDYGPIFVKGKEGLVITDWIFNTWGERWEPRPLDNSVPSVIASKFHLPRVETNLVLEGGSIDVNGDGLMITTESCLLSRTRNPHLAREKIEEALGNYLGIQEVIWLKEGIAGDDTSGHIDDIARFVDRSTVVCMVTSDRNDPNYDRLQENFQILKGTKGLDGKLLEVVPLPMPQPIPGPEGAGYQDFCIPASYANFYIANESVLLPVFGQETDAEVVRILQPFFPDRRIVAIRAVDLVWGLGGIHCVTQQQPQI